MNVHDAFVLGLDLDLELELGLGLMLWDALSTHFLWFAD